MIKNIVQLEHLIENKAFRFICDNDAPLHFIKEALFQFQKYIGQIEDAAKQQQQQNPVVEPKPEEPNVDAIKKE